MYSPLGQAFSTGVLEITILDRYDSLKEKDQNSDQKQSFSGENILSAAIFFVI